MAESACRSKEPSSSLYAAEANDKGPADTMPSPDNESSIDPRASFVTDEIRLGMAEQECRGNNKRRPGALEDRAVDLRSRESSGQQDRETSEGIVGSCVSTHAPTILLVGEKLLTPRGRGQMYAPKYATFLGISPEEEAEDEAEDEEDEEEKEETEKNGGGGGGGVRVNVSSRAKAERKKRSQCQRYEIDRDRSSERTYPRVCACG